MSELSRFHQAQNDMWQGALAELKDGRKRTHWMWFIFPQLRGLGHSPMAELYGIADLIEARAYLDDPILYERLVQCVGAILLHEGASAEEIMGPVDAKKLRSSATLFEAAGGGKVFARLLEQFYDGVRCKRTKSLLSRADT